MSGPVGTLVFPVDETPRQQRRRRLQRFLYVSLLSAEKFIGDVRHLFIIPDNSVCDKLPYFRDAVQSSSVVTLSLPMQRLLDAEKRGLPHVTRRPRPRFLHKRQPGLFEVAVAYAGLIYVLVNFKF